MSTESDSSRELLEARHYATLATHNEDGSIHLMPVWYLFEDGKLFVGTSSSSRKARNVMARPTAALMVDIRRLGSEKWVSASGSAGIMKGDPAKAIDSKIRERYLTRTALEDQRVGVAFAAADDATICLTPRTWRSWDVQDLDTQFFGGMLGKTPERWFLPLD
ncbi:MAG: pyridoxamine 5'-phosphate oxidase family protein [Acidobacteriota bacterium]